MKEFDRFSFPRNYSGKVPLFFRKFPEKFRRKFPEISELTTLVSHSFNENCCWITGIVECSEIIDVGRNLNRTDRDTPYFMRYKRHCGIKHFCDKLSHSLHLVDLRYFSIWRSLGRQEAS